MYDSVWVHLSSLSYLSFVFPITCVVIFLSPIHSRHVSFSFLFFSSLCSLFESLYYTFSSCRCADIEFVTSTTAHAMSCRLHAHARGAYNCRRCHCRRRERRKNGWDRKRGSLEWVSVRRPELVIVMERAQEVNVASPRRRLRRQLSPGCMSVRRIAACS